MKTNSLRFTVLIAIAIILLLQGSIYSQFVISRKTFEPNNISTWFQNTGIFNLNTTYPANVAGFVWPKNSGKTAIFTTGFSIAAKVNSVLRMAAASYTGEYFSGHMTGGVPYTDTNFRTYKVKRGDNNSNPDYANWGAMVPYGAPYEDVNHNGQYDPGIDIPGVENAEQTIFICMTDGFTARHYSGEGFGGGTQPLNAELRLTAWAYQYCPNLQDVQFIKFQIINKGSNAWNNTYFCVYIDSDLGDASNDYSGCDTIRNLGYCYNATNYDTIYGANPPAVGIRLLKTPVLQNTQIGLTSFASGCCPSLPLNCEDLPMNDTQAYHFMKGYKNDGTPWVVPRTTPPLVTKYCYSGDPETNTGWTEFKGRVKNCGGSLFGDTVSINPFGDRRQIINTGSLNLNMNPNDTQTVIIAQMIARGTSNLNSVTKLKLLSDTVQQIYNNGFDIFYSVSGNIKYLDNNQPVNYGSVKAWHLDNNGQLNLIDSAGIQTNGNYVLQNVPHTDVYIGAVPNSTQTVDYVITYYPASVYWQNATLINPTGNITNINISVIRLNPATALNSINGRITGNLLMPSVALKDVNVFAKNGSNFVGFAISDGNGIYHINSLPSGNLKIIANRIGYTSDSTIVNMTSQTIIDSVNFQLTNLSIGVKQISSVVPSEYKLYQNYPNPFNPVTTIKFDIPALTPLGRGAGGMTVLKIYDILGREVKTIVNEKLSPGSYEIKFNGANLPSGIYFYMLNTGDFKATKKLVLLK